MNKSTQNLDPRVLSETDDTHEMANEATFANASSALQSAEDKQRFRLSVAYIFAPFAVVLFGIFAAGVAIALKPKPVIEPKQNLGVLVETITAERRQIPVSITARGSVVPSAQIALSPEVGGRITYLNPQLVAGGRIAKGETLFRIDTRDYRLALASMQAQIDNSQAALQLEQGRSEVAANEWQKFGGQGNQDLATRKPQLASATTGLSAARSSAARARLSLSKTRVRAPFDGLVTMEKLEVGQLVGPGSQLGNFVATDSFWIQVSIPLSAVHKIAIGEEGTPAEISQDIGGQTLRAQGRVVRMLADLDPGGSMARVIVEVKDPLKIQEGAEGLPLLLNSYVTVKIEAPPVDDAIAIPREALHENNEVHIYKEAKLQKRQVPVLWDQGDTLLIGGDIQNGEEVIISRIPSPVAGTKLRKQRPEARSPVKETKAKK